MHVGDLLRSLTSGKCPKEYITTSTCLYFTDFLLLKEYFLRCIYLSDAWAICIALVVLNTGKQKVLVTASVKFRLGKKKKKHSFL